MDLNVCSRWGRAPHDAACAGPTRSPVPACGLSEAHGAVIGHDGSGAPLPGIGPHDFSQAQRVHEGAGPTWCPTAARVSLAPATPAAQYVVRSCPNAWHAAQSWLASRLFGALGLATPTVILVRGCSQAFDGTCDTERVFLATAYLPGCRTLGEWLDGDAACRVMEGAAHRAPDAADRSARNDDGSVRMLAPASCEAADAREQVSPDEAANVWRARTCAGLPDIYQCELERQYIAALWLGNRKLCDARMESVAVWRDREDLPRFMTMDFGASLFSQDAGPDLKTVPDEMADAIARMLCGEHHAPFVRRMSDLTSRHTLNAGDKAVRDALKPPNGVRAVAAEMAYRLGRIDARAVQPWVADACDFVRRTSTCSGQPVDAPDADGQIARILSRRDSVVKWLGGEHAAATWARLHATRAAAISAQQLPFLTQASPRVAS